MAVQQKKGNELTALDLAADTLIIIADPATGRYSKTTLDIFLSNARKEIIPFQDQTQMVIDLTNARKLKFGNALNITAEIIDDGNVLRKIAVDAVVDDFANPTQYTVTFAGVTTGRLLIF